MNNCLILEKIRIMQLEYNSIELRVYLLLILHKL